jgi:hypothetical protein
MGKAAQGSRPAGKVIAPRDGGSQIEGRERSMRMRPLITLLVAFCAFLPATPAHAGGLLSSVLRGVVSPSDTPSVCDANATQPFARFGDYRYYVLTPGGFFEPGTKAWSLSGGAKIVTGNETFYVRSSADRYSLYSGRQLGHVAADVPRPRRLDRALLRAPARCA